jgi:hypothetical protein
LIGHEEQTGRTHFNGERLFGWRRPEAPRARPLRTGDYYLLI